MEFDLGKFNLSELECLTNEEFKSLRTTMEGEVRQLEIEMNRVTILIDLLNRKEELLNEVTEGHTRIRSYKDYIVVDPPDTVIISSRSDNITIEVEDIDSNKSESIPNSLTESLITEKIQNATNTDAEEH